MLKANTPYMLRNDGTLLECGSVHPYIISSWSDDAFENYKKLMNKPQILEWFLNNSLNEKTKELINILKEGNFSREEDIIYDLADLANKEFCKVRTSNVRYKYGGNNGKIYFRIPKDSGHNWFDDIWKVVMNNKDFITNITVTKDAGSAYQDVRLDYVNIKDKTLHDIPTDEFLTLAGNPVIENKEVKEMSLEEGKKRYKYFAVSDNDSGYYYTIKEMKDDLKNFGNVEVRCYSLKRTKNVQDLDSEDLLFVHEPEPDMDELVKKAKEEEQELANLKADAEMHNHTPQFEDLETKECRLIWDDCTPARDRRPTTKSDIEEDTHLEEFVTEEQVLDQLLELAGYDKEDLEGETTREKIQDILGYFGDPGDGTPNILYLKIGDDILVDELEVDGATCSWEDVRDEQMKWVEEDEDDDEFESLDEAKSDDIKKFIQDLYELRKESINKDGEYGLGNLVFKEFRNKGYLDSLKTQRKVEKGKELSLETLEESDGMADKVKRTTKGFTKEHGQIICNGGEQEKEVVELLKKNGYLVEITDGKHGSKIIKYTKESTLKEELGSSFKEKVEMSQEDFNKWKEATKGDVQLKETPYGTLIYIEGANGPKHIGTYLKLFNVLWCDDISLFGHLKEVWTNGSGPGFYETIDYIRKEFEENEVPYEEYDDGEYTEFIVDETDKSLADMYISKWTMDYEWSEPDPTGKVSCKVPNEVLYWNR